VLTGLGGKGANQAVAAARAGADSRFLATVGDDPEGRDLLTSLAAAGVDTALVEPARGRATGTALITVDAAGENQIVVVPGANTATDADRIRAAADAVRAADVVVAQGEIPVAAIAQVAAVGPRRFVLNLAPFTEVSRDVLARVDVLVVNATEAGQVLGTAPPSGVAEAREAVTALASVARNAVVTLGRDGAVVAGAAAAPQGRPGQGGHDAYHVPVSRTVEVVDATGAGDAFVGVLAARLAVGAALHDAATAAVTAASATVAVRGAAYAYPDFAALLAADRGSGATSGTDSPGRAPQRATGTLGTRTH
jgi:ribokinase